MIPSVERADKEVALLFLDGAEAEEMRLLSPNEECVVPVDTLVRLASSTSEIKLIK